MFFGITLPALIGGTVYFGSLMGFLCFLCGQPVYLDYSRDIGQLDPGSNQRVLVKIMNLTGRDIEISGAQTSCSCIDIQPELPLSVSARRSANLTLVINVPNSRSAPVSFREKATFYLDGGTQRAAVEVGGRLVRHEDPR